MIFVVILLLIITRTWVFSLSYFHILAVRNLAQEYSTVDLSVEVLFIVDS
jgi:hypothetical protein